MSIYIHVCAQALLSIRWGIDGDFCFLLVTPLWCVDGELSSQRHGGESMLCNDSWLDGEEFARPSLATITSGTSMGIFLILVHSYIRFWRHDWTYQGTSSITHFTLYKGLRKKNTNTFYTILREDVELGGIELSKVPSSISIPSWL